MLQSELNQHKKHIEELKYNASEKASSHGDVMSQEGEMVRRTDYEALQGNKVREVAKMTEQIKILEKQHELEKISITAQKN